MYGQATTAFHVGVASAAAIDIVRTLVVEELVG